MDSKKILDLSIILLNVKNAISVLNSGEPSKLKIYDARTEAEVKISASADDKKSYQLSTAISNALLQYKTQVERDLMHAVR